MHALVILYTVFAATALLWTSASFAKCVSFKATNQGTEIDFAIPGDYIDICAKDKDLCTKLTAGFPPSVKTAGYFVTKDEWERYQTKIFTGFTDYLIAQFSDGNKVEDWKKLKAYLHEHNGAVDHSESRPNMKITGDSNLGIVKEGDDFITFGKTVSVHLVNDVNRSLTALNIIAKVKGKVLSLYTYQVMEKYDPSPTKKLAAEWVECIRKANSPAKK